MAWALTENSMKAQFWRWADGVKLCTQRVDGKETASQSPQSTRMPARLRLEWRYDLVQGLAPVKQQLWRLALPGRLVFRQLLKAWREKTFRVYRGDKLSDKKAITNLRCRCMRRKTHSAVAYCVFQHHSASLNPAFRLM